MSRRLSFLIGLFLLLFQVMPGLACAAPCAGSAGCCCERVITCLQGPECGSQVEADHGGCGAAFDSCAALATQPGPGGKGLTSAYSGGNPSIDPEVAWPSRLPTGISAASDDRAPPPSIPAYLLHRRLTL